MDRLS